MLKVTTSHYINGTLFMLVLGCSLSLAQDKGIMSTCGEQNISGTRGTSVERLVNPKGWTVPGLGGSHSIGSKVADAESEPGVPVYSTRLMPGKYTPIRLTHYKPTADSKVLVAEPSQYVQVIQSIEQYEANGHIFAYIIDTDTSAGCLPNSGHAEAKSRSKNGTRLLCSGFLLFGPTYMKKYDNDGDGTFATL